MNCYSNHRDCAKCRECDHAIYCEESTRLDRQVTRTHARYTSYPAGEADDMSRIPARSADGSHLSDTGRVLAELLRRIKHDPDQLAAMASFLQQLQRMHEANPKTCQVALTRLLDPQLSYSQIADLCGLKSRQLVEYYIRSAKALVPEFAVALDRDGAGAYSGDKCQNSALPRAIEKYGSIRALARALGCDHSAVRYWLQTRVPRDIETALRREIDNDR